MTSLVPDIYDPDFYVDGPIHEIFAELRRTQPVCWQDMPDGTGYWALLKHADVSLVARNPGLFSAQVQGIMLDDPSPENLSRSEDMLLSMDPPRHTAYRKPLSDRFKVRVIAQMQARIRELCQRIMNDTKDHRTVEFVHDIAGLLPSQVVGELVGIPEADWPQIRLWAEQSTSSQDPELAAPDSYTNQGMGEMAMYAVEFARRRRAEPPRDDLASLILAGNFGTGPMTDPEFATFFIQLVVAGNDTTKGMLSSGLLCLLEHPEQLEMLRSDPSLLPAAVEEILRYANPLHYFRRTATADTVVRDVTIRAGDKVAMWYTSANRDEDVFQDPQTFDIRRRPNPHLSFGIATHFCLGVHLARLEGRVFFEELLRTFPTMELIGTPRRIRSNLNNGLKSLNVQLST